MSRLRRVILALPGIALAAAGAIIWTAPDWLVDTIARRYPGCLYRVPTREPMIALTLDDGPDSISTPLILAELRKYGARATFFLISERISSQEALVRRIVAEGHEIGNHFSLDSPSIRLSQREFEEDLLRAHRGLAPFARLEWARPASGWYSQAMVSAMSRHGYRCALGSVYPFDAAIPSVTWAGSYILRNARPGAIIVLHDGADRGRRTARVLARIVPELQARGYRIVSLSELAATIPSGQLP
ncbi:MAG TPA: polysaccharide deacetylase family protein [Gemmatimonadales bacterium]|nr:polysaccharide deacetylase family protein [Gemmatimonadales bacterium]